LTRRALLLAATGGLLSVRHATGAAGADDVEVEPIALLPGLRLPPPPLILAMARVTLPPGVDTGATTVAGARLIVAEQGVLTVRVVGPDLPAAGPAPVGRIVSGPDNAIRLRQGQAIALPALAVDGLGNDRQEPVVVLDAAVFPAVPPRPRSFIGGDGADVRMLAVATLERAPDARVDFLLRRVALPAGAALPPQFGEGIAVLWVEEGRVAVEVAVGPVLLAVVAGRVGPTGSPRPAIEGAQAFLPTGSSAAIPAGATLRVAATPASAARLLLATLHPTADRGLRAAPNDDPGSRRDPRPRHEDGGKDGTD
jgi:hypothetical protein